MRRVLSSLVLGLGLMAGSAQAVKLQANGLTVPQVDGVANVPNPLEGEIYYDFGTGANNFYGYNGNVWVNLGGTGTSATATTEGVILKNRIQKKVLTSDVTDGAQDIMPFTGLTDGKIYKLSWSLTVVRDGAAGDTSVAVAVYVDGLPVSSQHFSGPTGASYTYNSSGEYYFQASDAGSVALRLGSITGSTKVDASTAERNWAILEELNNVEETSAW